ncbi:MAG: hypothetical protein LKK19_01785 [Bacteroidales bacterium]|jgi:hypothetical protein|nr:hypothetical protein [Bacteroidales bacterium]
MATTIIIGAVVLAVCIVGLGFNIFFRKNGKFPEGDISRNREMRKKDIVCSREEDLRIWHEKEDATTSGIKVTDATKARRRRKLRDKTACEGIGCHICD